ncbi:cache domain-containing protein [Butyrivibrio sp. WCE2006]|uniref:cache domain-containing protein n=1 Tax=Butyrivibrio sp. WCE2006 TaxID=1410611 RepID=UPI000679D9C1|nr:cache domain-containing protein [Butyrivibrio sp. WCE2006]
MKKHKHAAGIIIFVLITLIIVTTINLLLVFRTTADETISSGKYQLESIGADLENGIKNAKNLTSQYAIKAQPLILDKDALEKFIYDTQDKIRKETGGVGFNVYAAGNDWYIIPDLKEEEYDPASRPWYQGAIKNKGNAYVSSPYIDVVTGAICYTVSISLDDNDTVFAVDYTLSQIQNKIQKMSIADNTTSVIVTEDGIIAGSSEQSYVGSELIDAFPDYMGIFESAKLSDETVSYRLRNGLSHDNLFATGTESGWYLIVGINDWELYHNNYLWLLLSMVLNLIIFFVIFILYFISKNNEAKAQEALDSKNSFLQEITGDLKTPLSQILNNTDSRTFDEDKNYEARFESIQSATKQLSESIQQIISYSNYVKSENQKHSRQDVKRIKKISSKYRTIIIVLMSLSMLISVISISWMTIRWCTASMQEKAGNYESQVTEWTLSQKNILDMFVADISTNSDILKNPQETIDYLARITSCYEQISASYIANKDFVHSVYMNTGWRPDDYFRIEDRQWYMDTLNSDTGFNISSPYIDVQTGLYCITFSEVVNDAKTGDYLGVFGIDFYIDKLIDILGNSYTDTGYAFLTDSRGTIINHPHGTYQMTNKRSTNIAGLNYEEAYNDQGSVTVFKDYDNVPKVIIAKNTKIADFTVFVVINFFTIYGRSIVYGLIAFFSSLVCVFAIWNLLGSLITWQDQVNDQLQDSADAAIAAGKAKSDFLAMMSHEIRTPINAIIGMNEMILRECDNDDIKSYSANIQSASKTLLSLINSILDFSKIEEGKLEIVSVNYEAKALIADIINMISARINKTSLELKLEIDPKIPQGMYGDDFRIKQIILNLLTNAVKYTEKGSVTLKMSAKPLNKEEVLLDVKVCDTGIGIKDTDIDKLHASFQRLDEKRNRNIEGTGLGIAIVTSLLKMMGSNLEVKSVYGEGSEFSFVIQQKVTDWRDIGEFDFESIKADIAESTDKFLVAQDADILIVDDNEMNLSVMKSLLKRNKIKPDFASSGQECIDKAGTRHYDIIFLDHMMPMMDGIETLAILKERDLLSKDTTVIALTANAVVGAKEEYIAAGFADYLSKPVDTKILEKFLAKYLPPYKYTYVSADDEKVRQKTMEQTKRKDTIIDEDIIEFMPSTTMDESSKENIDYINKLKKLSYLDVDSAVSLSGSIDAYITVLQMFIRTAEIKKNRIKELYEKKDIKNYIIELHALKSSAKLIGAEELSSLAKDLEFAGKENDLSVIEEKNALIFEWYDRIISDINKTS